MKATVVSVRLRIYLCTLKYTNNEAITKRKKKKKKEKEKEMIRKKEKNKRKMRIKIAHVLTKIFQIPIKRDVF